MHGSLSAGAAKVAERVWLSVVVAREDLDYDLFAADPQREFPVVRGDRIEEATRGHLRGI